MAVADLNFGDLFDEIAKRIPDRPAVVYGESTLSWRVLDERSNRLARYLLRAGRLRVAADIEDEEAAGQIYAGANLLFFAVIEGAALFNIVVWLIQGNPVPNAFAAGLAVLLMVTNLPSEEGFKRLRELRGM